MTIKQFCNASLFFIIVSSLLWLLVTPKMHAGANYEMTVKVSSSENFISKSSATASIVFEKMTKSRCFYLAFNDDSYYFDPSQSINRGINQARRIRPPVGEITITKSSLPLVYLSDSLVKVENADNLEIEFEFELPEWAQSERKQKLFHGFYPQVLRECPTNEQEFYFNPSKLLPFQFTTKVLMASDVGLSTPYSLDQSIIRNFGTETSFNLTLGYRNLTVQLDKGSFEVVYANEDFLYYKDFFKTFLEYMTQTLGHLPYERLVLLETEELEKAAIPGFVTLNRPKQLGLNKIQNKYLNWGLWQLALFTAQQWFGADVFPTQGAQRWLIRGLADFMGNKLLKTKPRIDNILRYEGKKPWFRLTYRQGVDLLATVQKNRNPYNQILDEDFKLYNTFDNTEAFDYIRQVLMLRYLDWYLEGEFLPQIRAFYQKFSRDAVSYQDFYDFIVGQNRVREKEISRVIRLWWSQPDWPDYQLEQFDTKTLEDGSFQTQLHIVQPDEFKLAYDLSFEFADGESIVKRFEYDETRPQIIFDKKPRNVTINQGREVYDEDRFNNSSRWSRFHLWPGSAKTLYDDAYTFVWLPFLNKLPGEGLSLMLGLQLFKYLDAGMSIFVSHIPSEERTGFNVVYDSRQTYWGLGLRLSALQDYGPGFRDQRFLDVSAFKPYEPPRLPLRLQTNLSVRNRADLRLNENHSTYALTQSVTTIGERVCGLGLTASLEKTIPNPTILYERAFGLLRLGCRSRGYFAGFRSFLGKLTRDKGFAVHSQFNPQSLTEARIRIDSPILQGVDQLLAYNFDIETPLSLPITPYFLMLPKRSSLRLFFDYGESRDFDWHYQATGIGIRLPLGGDVVGKRSFAFGSLSLLAVINRQYEGVTATEPGFLLDFMGKL